MLQKCASRFLVPIARNAIQKRSQSVWSGPPTQHISSAEIGIMGSFIVFTSLIYPAYILFHIPAYRDAAAA